MSAGAKRWPQYLATFAATMGAFGLGTGIAWASPALPLLKKSCQMNLLAKNESAENCAFTFEDGIDEDQAKWVSSIFNLGAMVAAVMTGILLGKVGRKWAMIINCVPMALGYLCLMFPVWVEGTNPSFFFVGRFLTGKQNSTSLECFHAFSNPFFRCWLWWFCLSSTSVCRRSD